MNSKINSIKSIIFPSKKINIFVISILFLGLISGAVFGNIISVNDKTLVIDKIKLFISNINSDSINGIEVFKNGISVNMLYLGIIWVMGMTFVGVVLNVVILFIKSFILGFSLASFIMVYSYKGLILSLIYLLFGQILNILVIVMVTIYGIMFSSKLNLIIFKNKQDNNILKFFRNYVFILIIAIIVSIISSISEAFLLPAIIKIIIKLFI
ncbi:MAG: hypothetical protein MR835_00845 [Erysipelotrichaceae bacterium]|nr:hypothetical protein [Erysipelotrichaceae bacterium]MDY3934718.1 hypothetical protein [Bacilli bacterium]